MVNFILNEAIKFARHKIMIANIGSYKNPLREDGFDTTLITRNRKLIEIQEELASYDSIIEKFSYLMSQKYLSGNCTELSIAAFMYLANNKANDLIYLYKNCWSFKKTNLFIFI
ncbi:hypothetical protein Xmau_02105 [Xenorhabdus mauleonii]|uniref:Uncharacterized protein n=1 Tax=Xenorhabdus mauleonii TaxID=351675 RepID=A0A1I3QJW7_9GAMM|nr:hypothetical protein [Xenorhabdus mauleonii]PHM39923.1 hypothetical protein Xmau_02105 [Xenorhabdus mauleonii]SFJ34434.1 hypothetical protein SAMN05421680_107202 [Xenorhabdus mauleonii]